MGLGKPVILSLSKDHAPPRGRKFTQRYPRSILRGNGLRWPSLGFASVTFHCNTFWMKPSDTPKPYSEWRSKSIDRAEDAAHVFGYDLMQHCRNEALKKIEPVAVPANAEEYRAQVALAVDTALHNVMDLLEGFWRTESGQNHTVQYALSVCVKDASRTEVERIAISPCLIDLPIGYWMWQKGEFR